MSLPRSDQKGFALAALIIFFTALSILLAASVPAYRVQAQRELEEELIFRGQEYVRAIQKYQRQLGIYPPNTDALIETNGIRYLRRAYTDPITGENFRLLTVNPDGTINGSTLFQQAAGPELFQGRTPQRFGATDSPLAGGDAVRDGRGGEGGRGGGLPGGAEIGGPQGFNPTGSQQPGLGQPIAPNANPFGAPGGFAPASQAGRGGGFAEGRAAGGPPSQQSQPPGQEGSRSGQIGAGAGADQPLAVGGVVGVAPANEDSSLKLYNQRAIYSEWEFIAIPGFGTIPAVTSAPGQVPGQPAGLQSDQSSPFSTTQPNPFNQ